MGSHWRVSGRGMAQPVLCLKMRRIHSSRQKRMQEDSRGAAASEEGGGGEKGQITTYFC